ncbi:hypothetical protein EVAR_13182_1 [Eumeta japonica]|uniref:Uncharacterized protein n=1 Tax=Eumeta variegata TaxID=151549 RepID=A0A4C1TS23_EUMVA|nr:hypothetical protein EVAR_13182_1 [Eumeta japonica]
MRLGAGGGSVFWNPLNPGSWVWSEALEDTWVGVKHARSMAVMASTIRIVCSVSKTRKCVELARITRRKSDPQLFVSDWSMVSVNQAVNVQNNSVFLLRKPFASCRISTLCL